MALLPDAAAAGLYALVVFLVTLGVLAVFVEKVRGTRVAVVILASLVAAAALYYVAEPGVALLVLGFGAAFPANEVFEWLTTR